MIQLSKISFAAISYHTEFKERVTQVLVNCTPESIHKKIQELIIIDYLSGQFGETIRFHRLDIEKNQLMKKTLKFLLQQLQEAEVMKLLEEFDSRYDEDDKTLFFRLNKFTPYDNTITLGEGSDVIRCSIKFSIYTKQSLEEIKTQVSELFTSMRE